MDGKWEEVAGRMVARVRELHVRENGMRTDVEAAVEGIAEGNALQLCIGQDKDGLAPAGASGTKCRKRLTAPT